MAYGRSSYRSSGRFSRSRYSRSYVPRGALRAIGKYRKKAKIKSCTKLLKKRQGWVERVVSNSIEGVLRMRVPRSGYTQISVFLPATSDSEARVQRQTYVYNSKAIQSYAKALAKNPAGMVTAISSNEAVNTALAAIAAAPEDVQRTARQRMG